MGIDERRRTYRGVWTWLRALARVVRAWLRALARVDRPTSSGVSITAERAHELSRRLGVSVKIDETGWLIHGVALCYQRGPGGTIQPKIVLVGPNALVEDVLKHDLVAGCARYNDAIKGMRALRDRLHVLSKRGLIAVTPGSATLASYQALLRLDALIETRQSGRMGNDFVSAEILQREIEFFERLHAEHERGVVVAERPGASREAEQQ